MNLNKIMKKEALQELNGKVKLVGSYINTTYVDICKQLFYNMDNLVKPYLKDTKVRIAEKVTNTQIKFKYENENNFTYLTSLTNSKFYKYVENDYTFIIICTIDGFVIVYNICN